VANVKILFIVGLLCASALTVNAQHKQFHYDTETIALTGKVIVRTFFGPPNYGENPKTDSRESQYILLLDVPVDVIGTPRENKTEPGVKQITLVVLDFKANPVERWLHKRVTVEGTLFHANTGHHHTKVLIEVSSIGAAKRGKSH
jgi:hypothetical protein